MKQQIIDCLVRNAFTGPEVLESLYHLPHRPSPAIETLWATRGIAGQDLVELCRDRTAYIKALSRTETYSRDLLLEGLEKFPPLCKLKGNFLVPKGYKLQSIISPLLWYHRIKRGVLERLVTKGERYPTIEIHLPRPTLEIFPWQNAVSAHEEMGAAPWPSNWPSVEVLSKRYVRVGPATGFETTWIQHAPQWPPTGYKTPISVTISKVFVSYADAKNEYPKHEVALVLVSANAGRDKPDFDEFLSSFR